ncbi:Peptidase HybD-like domain protein [Acididesulfobacillus acetoxydans]|uniref:Hydrogenase maturation protease n=1 Tax=Acididesulfobacillus acetoxydans TaxID=1561005 RepID=A0A8S0W6V5_9FIRM|nr:HyaD/HybD family hydrogenase maturation endopeptidase [Acididesulfobacillus acetoxydans]CAA7600179.1 Peptidase HybD-like domain protein [Acididesulfobacillus acetoxydans]CEJ09557.1 Hydrogenase maturation protease [Acididesulfobacillus acetoxydans]
MSVAAHAKTLILGVGNELLQDEGLGIHAARLLTHYDLPPNVEVIEAGTAGPQLLSLIEGVEHLIVLDSIDAKAEPGAIFHFKPADLGAFPQGYMASIHDVGLLEVLQIADLLGQEPDTDIFAMQPAVIAWGLAPSPEIQARLRDFTNLVYSELAPAPGRAGA